MKRFHSEKLLFVLVVLCASGVIAAEPAASRERLLLDFGWKFRLGNEWGVAQNLAKAATGSGPASTWFSDASWRSVNLPHDWAVELPFDPTADAGHGFKALGRAFPSNSVAWYRRTFDLSRVDASKRLWLEFDGVYRDCTVFFNGWFVGHHESGYSSFRFDVTDIANFSGKNVIAVKVDASDFEGWFYEGAGIYRHVWLVKTGPVAIAPDGLFVRTGPTFMNVSNSVAVTVNIELDLVNPSAFTMGATVVNRVVSPDGELLAEARTNKLTSPSSRTPLKFDTEVVSPKLWSPEEPILYKLQTTVEAAGRVVDRVETEFGIRTVAFDAEKGFVLNGKPYLIKGTCNHQDHAGVGAAMPDRLQYFRIARLKEMGCNAYRTSHNPPTPELLEACDRLGMLVMDENRLLGSDPKHMDELERLVRRDRNHASVVVWSIANEEFGVQATPAGGRVAATMQRLVKQLDPTRPVTCAANLGNTFEGVNSAVEVRGWNYHLGQVMDDYHKAHPTQPNVGTEQGSTVSTRGIYANDRSRGYVSAYDDNAPHWAHTAETWWSFFAPRPWLSGGFVWTGFDYRGEPTPYGWPCINSHFGILDMCGFPKDNFYYYQSWWTDRPVLHLLPHWNWPGREGREIDVRALSNCEEVELFLNAKSLGKQVMKTNSHLKWKVKYEPGTLSAKGFKQGKVVVESKVETAGAPAAVRFEPDRAAINANGEDISVITVSVRDAQGRLVPTASNSVQFTLEGPGKILGVGNGDPSCHEPDVFVAKWPVRSLQIHGWRWQRTENPYNERLPEVAPSFDDSSWPTHNARSESGPLGEREHGVFRVRFQVTEEELRSEAVEMAFGMIDEEGWIYVNGQKAGESRDWQVAPVVDVKRFLRPGENIVAVVVANNNGAGGVNKSVALQFQEKPELPEWQRSVFNGLAQIIVQSSKEPGEIKLTGRAAGLEPVTVTLKSQAAPLRAAVP